MSTVGELLIPNSDYDAIIFDCDGTLVDSMPLHFEAWQRALLAHGAPGVFQEDVFHAMGGRPTLDIVAEINDEYDLKLNPEMVALSKREYFLETVDQVSLIDEVATFANSMRGKVPMAIASGGCRRVIEKTLSVVGCSDWFDEVVTSDDVALGKPDPDIFLYAAQLLGVDPKRCLVFEDAPAGVVAAQRAGMQVVVVPSPLCSKN